MHPGGVHDDQLPGGPGHHPADGVPGGLRLGGRDGDLLADHRVHQGGLARVRPAHEADQPGSAHRVHESATSPSGRHSRTRGAGQVRRHVHIGRIQCTRAPHDDEGLQPPRPGRGGGGDRGGGRRQLQMGQRDAGRGVRPAGLVHHRRTLVGLHAGARQACQREQLLVQLRVSHRPAPPELRGPPEAGTARSPPGSAVPRRTRPPAPSPAPRTLAPGMGTLPRRSASRPPTVST